MVAEQAKLLEFEEAFEIVVTHAKTMPTEVVSIDHLLGRVLAKPVLSTCDLPPFDNSAVDGYALSLADVMQGIQDRQFRLSGEMKAGTRSPVAVEAGEAVRVFTGAPVPEGTGGIAMQEVADRKDGHVCFREAVRIGDHIRPRGSEVQTGEVIVSEGLVSPAVIGALAAAGVFEAEVYQLPLVGLLITGDELIQPGTSLAAGQIYESNGAALASAISAMGLGAPTIVRAPDNLTDVKAALSKLMDECDVVLTTGGVSVGDYDVVRPALKELGVKEIFWGVAMKPGKPLYFGRHTGCTIFGLPGNPVSALTTFALFVRPYLRVTAGLNGQPRRQKLTLIEELAKKAGRIEFVPCSVSAKGAQPMVDRASHKAGCLAAADGFVVFEKNCSRLESGATVDVIELKWGCEE